MRQREPLTAVRQGDGTGDCDRHCCLFAGAFPLSSFEMEGDAILQHAQVAHTGGGIPPGERGERLLGCNEIRVGGLQDFRSCIAAIPRPHQKGGGAVEAQHCPGNRFIESPQRGDAPLARLDDEIEELIAQGADASGRHLSGR